LHESTLSLAGEKHVLCGVICLGFGLRHDLLEPGGRVGGCASVGGGAGSVLLCRFPVMPRTVAVSLGTGAVAGSGEARERRANHGRAE
jgi:hypothetical protein